jgi:predicted RNA-binding protein YlqC (UPF0109 family)
VSDGDSGYDDADAGDSATDADDPLDDEEFDADDDADDVDGNRIPAARARAVLEFLVSSVVEDPDGVKVEATESRGRVNLDVHVAPGDMGRVIGKRGRIANAIRTVVRAAAVRDGVDIDVEFVE